MIVITAADTPWPDFVTRMGLSQLDGCPERTSGDWLPEAPRYVFVTVASIFHRFVHTPLGRSYKDKVFVAVTVPWA